jgi:hypothetical protein
LVSPGVTARVGSGSELDEVGPAVAGRKLDQAEPVAMAVQTHGLGVDRDYVAEVEAVGQVAPVEFEGHAVTPRMVPRRRLELPRGCPHRYLKPARLPIPPPGLLGAFRNGGDSVQRGVIVVNAVFVLEGAVATV